MFTALFLACLTFTFSSGKVIQAECQNFLDLNDANLTPIGKVIVSGGGSSFPDRILQDASFAYSFQAPDVAVSFKAFGSGSGKCRMMGYCENCDHPFQDDLVGPDNDSQVNLDFVASDSLFTDAEYSAVPDLQMYPSVAGAVVPIYNLKEWGITDLVLSPIAISQIFRQCKDKLVYDCEPDSIAFWNDPKIVALNPQHELMLNLAGKIEVIVREDKSGTTEIFKKSLATFEAAFASQIGTSSTATWEHASVTFAASNAGVAGTVLSRSGSIGYSVLAEVRTAGLNMARILKPGYTLPIEASAESVKFAVMELGLDFGNTGDSPDRLTANIHNGEGSQSWPIAGYSYFVIRKNFTRQGATCANRLATFRFFEWFYTNDVVPKLASTHGFSALPAETSAIVFGHLKRDMLCVETGLPVYQPAPVVKVQIVVSPVLYPLIDILGSVYSLLDDDTELVLSASDSVANRNFGVSTTPLVAKIGLESNAPVTGGKHGVVNIPLIGIPFVPISSLCGATSTCPYNDIELSMTPQTLGDILEHRITNWNDERILAADYEGNPVVLPSLNITVVRSTNEEEIALETVFVKQMGGYVDGFIYSFAASGANENVRTEPFTQAVMSTVYATPGSIAVIIATSNVETSNALALKINLIMDADADADADLVVAPSVENINSGEWPFSVNITFSYPTQFSGNGCRAGADLSLNNGLVSSEKFSKFIFWFLDQNSIERPINNNGMSLLPLASGVSGSEDALEELRFSVLCDGQSLMKPVHDISVTSMIFVVFVYFLFGLFSLIIVGLAVWTRVYRKTKIIRTSTYSFMLQILFGALISLATVIPLLADDRALYEDGSDLDVSDYESGLHLACQSVPFLFFTGYGVMFTPLLLKTWRVVKLFNSKSLKRMTIPTSQLIKYEFLIMIPVIGVLVTWNVMDPLLWKRTIMELDELTGGPIKSIGRCESEKPSTFMIPLLCFVAITLVYGNILSFKGRNVPSAFSEGKWITVALINFFECFLLCVPLMVVTADIPDLDAIVKCMFVLIVNVGTIVIIFGPKMYVLYTGAKDVLGNKALSSNSSTGKSTNRSSIKSRIQSVMSRSSRAASVAVTPMSEVQQLQRVVSQEPLSHEENYGLFRHIEGEDGVNV